jgi:hypothetical protein
LANNPPKPKNNAFKNAQSQQPKVKNDAAQTSVPKNNAMANAQNAAVVEPPKHKAPSLLGQLSNAVTALPSATVHLAAETVKSVPGALKQTVMAPVNAVTAGPEAAQRRFFKDVPIAEQFRASGSRTGGRLTDLASVPFGQQSIGRSKYGQAVKQGTILPTVLEDVGNVGLASAGASKIAGLAGAAGIPGAEALSSGLGKVSTLGADVAGGPAKVYTAIPNAIRSAARLGGVEIPTVSEGISAAAEAFARRNPGVLERFPTITPLGREGRASLQKNSSEAGFLKMQHERAMKLSDQVGADADTTAASLLVHSGQGARLANAEAASIGGFTDEQLAHQATGGYQGDLAASPAAARMAADYASGRLAPEKVAQIDQLNALRDPLAAQREAGVASRGNLKDEQLGYKPMSDQNALPHEVPVSDLPARLRIGETTGRRATADLRAQADEFAGSLPFVRDALHDAADDAETFIAQMEASGQDVTHVISGDPLARKSAAQVQTRKFSRMPARLSETMRKETMGHPLTNEGFYQNEWNRTFENVRNKAALDLETSVGSLPADLGVDATNLSGAALDRTMAAEGYTRVRPDKFGPSTADSRYVPDYLKNAYDHEFMGAGHRMPILPAVNRAWKTAVLPLSPKWHIGNVVGNLFMATVFGGTTPLQLIAQLGDARQMVKEGILNDSSQARLYTSNMTRGELGRGLVGQHGEIIGPHTNPSMLTPKGFIQASYRANSFIDDVTRTAVYLSKIDKGLSPEIAVRESLNAMGDFTRMTPFERNTIREIIPFYAWMRHVTQAAIRLPIEHPMRAAWMIALANEYGDPQGDLPAYFRSGLHVGNVNIPLGNMSPLNDVVSRSPFSLPGLAAAVSPAIKVPAEVGLGLDMSHLGTKPIATRPPEAGGRDAKGQLQFGKPILNPASIGNILVNQVPLARGLRDFIQGPAGRYGGTGQIIRDDKGNPVYPDNSGRVNALLRTLVPFPRKYTEDTGSITPPPGKKNNAMANVQNG